MHSQTALHVAGPTPVNTPIDDGTGEWTEPPALGVIDGDRVEMPVQHHRGLTRRSDPEAGAGLIADKPGLIAIRREITCDCQREVPLGVLTVH